MDSYYRMCDQICKKESSTSMNLEDYNLDIKLKAYKAETFSNH